MQQAESRVKEYVVIGAIVLLIVVSLPLLAPVAFTLRALLLPLGVAALLGGWIAYRLNPSFREWFQAHADSEVDYKGLKMATDVTFHPSHSWARMEGDDTVLVGADDLVQAMLGPVEAIDLPPEGRRVRRGEPLFAMRHGSRVVDVRSPVTGTVTSRNAALGTNPSLINEEPFNRGWAVRLRSEDAREDERWLLQGKKAREWFHCAVDRVIGLLAPKSAVAVIPDGGVLVGELHKQIDDATWQTLTETEFKSEPDRGESRS
jgi:glycine cleavage system H protein